MSITFVLVFVAAVVVVEVGCGCVVGRFLKRRAQIDTRPVGDDEIEPLFPTTKRVGTDDSRPDATTNTP